MLWILKIKTHVLTKTVSPVKGCLNFAISEFKSFFTLETSAIRQASNKQWPLNSSKWK